MKEHYITAVLKQLASGMSAEDTIEGLKKTLNRRGHDRLLPVILRGVVRVLESDNTDVVIAKVASESAVKTYAKTIKASLEQLNASSEPKIEIDKTLIGGYIAEANYKRLDASYKSKLVTLYRSLTNSS